MKLIKIARLSLTENFRPLNSNGRSEWMKRIFRWRHLHFGSGQSWLWHQVYDVSLTWPPLEFLCKCEADRDSTGAWWAGRSSRWGWVVGCLLVEASEGIQLGMHRLVCIDNRIDGEETLLRARQRCTSSKLVLSTESFLGARMAPLQSHLGLRKFLAMLGNTWLLTFLCLRTIFLHGSS